VSQEYAEDELLMPDGLTVSVEPSSFTAYPNAIYQLAIILETAAELAPGVYFLRFEQHLEQGFSSGGWITVTVEG